MNVKEETRRTRRRMERRRGGAERHGRQDESIVCMKEMHTCQTIEKMLILMPQIPKFRLRRRRQPPPAGIAKILIAARPRTNHLLKRYI